MNPLVYARPGMSPGDIVAVLSDGLIEPHDPDNKLFGKDRVIDLITARLDRTPEEILRALVDEIETFTAGAPPDDDRTAVIIKRQIDSPG